MKNYNNVDYFNSIFGKLSTKEYISEKYLANDI